MRSSARQFSDFIEGFIWQDMLEELGKWREQARDGLEDMESDEKELYRNQGRADAVRYFMSLPEVLRDSLLEDQEQDINFEKEDLE